MISNWGNGCGRWSYATITGKSAMKLLSGWLVTEWWCALQWEKRVCWEIRKEKRLWKDQIRVDDLARHTWTQKYMREIWGPFGGGYYKSGKYFPGGGGRATHYCMAAPPKTGQCREGECPVFPTRLPPSTDWQAKVIRGTANCCFWCRPLNLFFIFSSVFWRYRPGLIGGYRQTTFNHIPSIWTSQQQPDLVRRRHRRPRPTCVRWLINRLGNQTVAILVINSWPHSLLVANATQLIHW